MENDAKKEIPTLQEAKILLEEAGKLNPVLWVEHSINVVNSVNISPMNSSYWKRL